MDGIEVARDLRVGLVRSRGREDSKTSGGWHRVAVVRKRDSEALRGTVAAEVFDDGVASAVIVQEVDSTNLDEALDLVGDENLTRNGDGLEACLVAERRLGLDAEDERGASLQGLRLIMPLEPFL